VFRGNRDDPVDHRHPLSIEANLLNPKIIGTGGAKIHPVPRDLLAVFSARHAYGLVGALASPVPVLSAISGDIHVLL